MKAMTLLLSIFFAAPLVAQAVPSPELLRSTLEQVPTCGNFIRFDEKNLYLGFGSYSNGPEKPPVSKPAQVLVAPLGQTQRFALNTQDSAIDLITEDNKAWILTYTGLELWDVSTRQVLATYPTHVNSYFGDQEHPRAFARYQDLLVIAHGRLGVSFFDMKTKKVGNYFQLIQGQKNLESMATGIAILGKYAYVVMDSYTLVERNAKPPFRGIVVIDLETQTVVNELDGMDPGADSVSAVDGNIFVSFMGQPIWKYRVSALMGAKLPEPAKRVWKFPWEGRAVGAAALDAKYYYTCFSKMPGPGEGIYFKRLPVALDRRVLMLD